jgi:FtsZ-binding cell division protein ZapB
MSLVPLVAVVMVFAIPILGIALAGYKEWLKFKSKHQELGTSTREVEAQIEALQDRLAHLEDERDALRERVQNLETIVTSEAWIAEHDESSAPPSLDEEAPLELPETEDSPRDDADHTAELARRLRGQ